MLLSLIHILEFVRAASRNEEEFDRSVAALHEALDKAADKVRSKHPAEISMVGQVDALIDTLYLTYGSFVLMGVDPEEVFEIVHMPSFTSSTKLRELARTWLQI